MNDPASDTEVLSAAIRRWSSKMASAKRAEADAYELLATALDEGALEPWEPASDLPFPKRPERQAILLAAVQARAKILRSDGIPRDDWLRLARHFGYDPRGTAGFFRRSSDGTPGLLIKEDDRDVIRVAEAGLRRISEYATAIEAAGDAISTAAMMGS